MTPHHLMAHKFGTYLQKIKSDFYFLHMRADPTMAAPTLDSMPKEGGSMVHLIHQFSSVGPDF